MSDAPQSHAAAGPARRPGCFAVIAWILVGLGVACTIPTLIVSIVPGI